MRTKAELIARDICDGAAEIGVFLERSSPQAAYLCRTRQIPAYKEAGRWKLRPSRYLQHIATLEDATVRGAS